MENLKTSVLDEYCEMVKSVYKRANNLFDNMHDNGFPISFTHKQEMFSGATWRYSFGASAAQQFNKEQIAQLDELQAACNEAGKLGTVKYYKIHTLKNHYTWNGNEWGKCELIHRDNIMEYVRNKEILTRLDRPHAELIRGCINWVKAGRELIKTMQRFEWGGKIYYYEI